MVRFQVEEPRPQPALAAPPFHAWDFKDGTPWTRFHRSAEGYLLRFPGLADFQVARDGSGVRCWPAEGVDEETLRHLYQNQVWPLAMSRQGKLVFHASAVEIDGAGIAFMGATGLGKSTLSAAFATAGWPFLTDDGLVVEPAGDGFSIAPSHPSIRLWPDSREALLDADAAEAPGVPYTSKSRFLAGAGMAYCAEPRPLRRIYLLGDRGADRPVLHPVAPGDALIELVRHSFLLDIEERDLLAAHFNELARMVNEPIYYRLDYPRRFEALGGVRQAILDHARQAEHRP